MGLDTVMLGKIPIFLCQLTFIETMVLFQAVVFREK